MAPPLRKPAGAQVAPLRCLTLRLLAPEVYHDWRMFSRVLNSIVLDMGSTLRCKRPVQSIDKPNLARYHKLAFTHAQDRATVETDLSGG